MLEARAALEKAGHKLIPFEPPEADVSLMLGFKLVGGDEGKNLLTMLYELPSLWFLMLTFIESF